jgi:hypothetical protein
MRAAPQARPGAALGLAGIALQCLADRTTGRPASLRFAAGVWLTCTVLSMTVLAAILVGYRGGWIGP